MGTSISMTLWATDIIALLVTVDTMTATVKTANKPWNIVRIAAKIIVCAYYARCSRTPNAEDAIVGR